MIQFSKHTFENGLRFIYHEDSSTPFIVVNVLYDIGAKHENPERTGFAHLFEHLMFEGTTNQPNYDHPIQLAGGSNNAFTNNDFTNYYIKLPKENVEMALWLEADRMLNLDINAASLSNQQKVVIEEFKENYTNKPYGDVWHILREMIFEKHPYQWPTIGKDYNHIAEASLEEVVNFYKKHYQPSNAILSICGNIEEAKALKYAAQLMGSLPSVPTTEKLLPVEPIQTQAKSKTVLKSVPQDAIYVVFKVPGRNDAAYYIADILTDLLASGKSSRLNERLVRQQQLFTRVDAYTTGSIDIGTFVFEGRLMEGITPEQGLAAIWKEIEILKSELIPEKELNKIKNKLLTYLAFSENDLMNRAIGLCYHELLGDAASINDDEAKYIAITSEQIQAFAQNFLNEAQSNTLLYLKEDKNDE